MKAANDGSRCPTLLSLAPPAACTLVCLVLLACSGNIGANTDRRANPAAPNAPGASVPGGPASSAANGGAGSGPGAVINGGGGPQPRPLSLEGEPIYSRFVRLTNEQWSRSVKDILALDVPPDAAKGFEDPVAGTTDFTNNELVLSVTSALWQSQQTASEQAATLATSSTQTLARIYNGTDPSAFIRLLGRRAFRRPLTAAEEQSYGMLFTTGAGSANTFAKGAALVIRGLLQSPYFLYRSELSADRAPLTGYELASKLSFWLLGTTPSDALLDSAAAGKLDTPEGAASIATQLLEQPAAAETMQQFHRELVHFDRYSTISKIGVAGYTEALNAEFEQASYAFFDRVFRKGLGLRDILTSTVGFVGPSMARLYGVTAPASGVAERDLGPTRAGYFAQLPFLTLYAFNEQPDPIHRGLTLNLNFLCADPGKPLADLPPLPPLKPGQTNREMITTLTGGCGQQCHTYYINPLGFAFENFDGMGRVRNMDNGRPVDTKAAYPFSEGVREFADAGQLMQLMADSKQAHACYAKHIASYGLQRDIVQADLPLLDALTRVSMGGGSIKQVIVELVKDPAFRTRIGGVR